MQIYSLLSGKEMNLRHTFNLGICDLIQNILVLMHRIATRIQPSVQKNRNDILMCCFWWCTLSLTVINCTCFKLFCLWKLNFMNRNTKFDLISIFIFNLIVLNIFVTQFWTYQFVFFNSGFINILNHILFNYAVFCEMYFTFAFRL